MHAEMLEAAIDALAHHATHSCPFRPGQPLYVELHVDQDDPECYLNVALAGDSNVKDLYAECSACIREALEERAVAKGRRQMNATSIPWADFTWNPITGCTKGCDYCYARKVAARFGLHIVPEPTTTACVSMSTAKPFPFDFAPTIYPHRLDEPLRRKKPSCIFLGSMGDLFDPAFPDEFRDRVFMATLVSPRHTFLLLTKQPENMRRYFSDPDRASAVFLVQPNLWLGVTVTNQADADERIPLLLDTPAAHRFVSVEPMLGPVDLTPWLAEDFAKNWPGIDWVIAGAKTPGKPLHDADCNYWCPSAERGCAGDCDTQMDAPYYALTDLRDQCAAASVPFFYKHGKETPALDGVVHAEIPQ